MISVIVPIYKVEKYLNKCVESVFVQTFEDYELILADDGTGDSCAEMSDEYGLCDTRVITIHKPNGGLSDARNKGLDIATGEYINFLDSDDYVMPEMLAEMKTALEEANADMCVCGFNRVDEEGNVIDTKSYGDATLSRMEALEMLVQGNVVFITAWAKLYKRFIFNDLRFPFGKIHEDEFVAHYVIGKSKRIAIIDKANYQYLVRNDSIMGLKKKDLNFHAVEAYLDRVNYFHKTGNELFAARVLVQTISLLLSIKEGFTKDNEDAKSEGNKLRKEIIKVSKTINLKKLPITSKISVWTYKVSDGAYKIWRKLYGICHR